MHHWSRLDFQSSAPETSTAHGETCCVGGFERAPFVSTLPIESPSRSPWNRVIHPHLAEAKPDGRSF